MSRRTIGGWQMSRRTSGTRGSTVVVLAAVLALVLTACTGHVDPGSRLPSQASGGFGAEVKGKLRSAVEDAMKQSDASAALVGVWAPWSGSWVSGLGTTTAKGTTPVSADMNFRIAQNTMPMTCTVLLGLVDDGTVRLDDAVSKYLPGMVGVDGITLRELCQNTSGVGDYASELAAEFVANPTREWPQLELVSDGIAAKPFGKPGEKYGLSATNFVLLGMALQNASGKSWTDLYNTYVFGRLGMNGTSLPSDAQVTVPGAHPTGYVTPLDAAGARVCEKPTAMPELSPSMGWTAMGVVSNVSDLKSFVQALATGALVSGTSAKAQANGITIGASWQKYGLGTLMLGPLRGNVGAVPGYLSAMFSDPTSGLTVVVALNNSTPGVAFIQALAQRLVSIAAKAPVTQKGTKAVTGLPWSEDQTVAELARTASCTPKK
ncbi:serine hydrolase domain-containing protein [Leifsonia poae]|uniref:serine hydrolase domain-containing protein n=1 Tax=Leifsonia poae TaxID=110933 RepID=UPI001CBB3F30|nr:serine hydrolase domain-containing protein [Leifsonia poae]